MSVKSVNSSPTNPMRVRGGHIGHLKVLYREAIELILQNANPVYLSDVSDRIDSQFQKYIASHDVCSSSSNPSELIESHTEQMTLYQSMKHSLKQALPAEKRRSGSEASQSRKPHSKSAHSFKSSSSKSSSASNLLDSKVKSGLLQLKLKQIEEKQEFERQQQQIEFEQKRREEEFKLQQQQIELEQSQQEEEKRRQKEEMKQLQQQIEFEQNI